MYICVCVCALFYSDSYSRIRSLTTVLHLSKKLIHETKSINFFFIIDYVCDDLIYTSDLQFKPAYIQTVLTSSNMTTFIIIPCTSIEILWITIQQRVDDSLSFMQDRTAYTEGFGSTDGNYFMGFNKIHALTYPTQNKRLQIVLESFDGDVAVMYYESFYLGNWKHHSLWI